MIKKEKFDGRSRPTNKDYEESWNRIFGKKKKPLDKEDEDIAEELKKIEERNGF